MEQQNSHNPYAAPASKLEPTTNQADGINTFRTRSTLLVIVFTLLSLGLYMAYWMYNRTQTLNRLLPENPVHQGLYVSALLTWLFSIFLGLVVLISQLLLESGYVSTAVMVNPMIQSVLDIASSLLFLIWAFVFRNRLNQLLGAQAAGHRLRSGPILTFLLQGWYLNYKINQAREWLPHLANLPEHRNGDDQQEKQPQNDPEEKKTLANQTHPGGDSPSV